MAGDALELRGDEGAVVEALPRLAAVVRAPDAAVVARVDNLRVRGREGERVAVGVQAAAGLGEGGTAVGRAGHVARAGAGDVAAEQHEVGVGGADIDGDVVAALAA